MSRDNGFSIVPMVLVGTFGYLLSSEKVNDYCNRLFIIKIRTHWVLIVDLGVFIKDKYLSYYEYVKLVMINAAVDLAALWKL